MHTSDENAPVRAKAILIDPASMTVLWANEAALGGSDLAAGVLLEQVVPMAEPLGVASALRGVAETGTARHLRVDLVSTARGTMQVVISVHRLPGGELLVLQDEDWQAARKDAEANGRSRRRMGR